jgi:hypothetical protein
MTDRISHSELSAWRSCHALWGFRYAERLVPVADDGSKLRGRFFHAGLDAAYRALQADALASPASVATLDELVAAAHDGLERAYDDALAEAAGKVSEAVLDELRAQAREGRELDRFMVAYALRRTVPLDRSEGLIPLLVEDRFDVPLPDAIGRAVGHLRFVGIIDLVWWAPRSRSLIVDEHKTSVRDPSEIARRAELDPQTSGYLYALRHRLDRGELDDALMRASGGLVDGSQVGLGLVRFNCSRRKLPSVPQTNKDGTVSTAQIDTLPELYEAALAAQAAPEWAGKNPERFQALIEKQQRVLAGLRARPETYFKRVEHWQSFAQMKLWRDEMFVDAARIRAARRQPHLRTRNTEHCTAPGARGCRFASICLNPEAGSDVREREFYVREPQGTPKAEG